MLQQTFQPTDLLTCDEAAKYLNLAPATLRNWRALKQGPTAQKIGKRAVRYRFADLEAFIATSTEGAA